MRVASGRGGVEDGHVDFGGDDPDPDTASDFVSGPAGGVAAAAAASAALSWAGPTAELADVSAPSGALRQAWQARERERTTQQEHGPSWKSTMVQPGAAGDGRG